MLALWQRPPLYLSTYLFPLPTSSTLFFLLSLQVNIKWQYKSPIKLVRWFCKIIFTVIVKQIYQVEQRYTEGRTTTTSLPQYFISLKPTCSIEIEPLNSQHCYRYQCLHTYRNFNTSFWVYTSVGTPTVLHLFVCQIVSQCHLLMTLWYNFLL